MRNVSFSYSSKGFLSQKYKIGSLYLRSRSLVVILLLILIATIYCCQYYLVFEQQIANNAHSRQRYQSDIFDPFSFNSDNCRVKKEGLADSRQNATMLMLARNQELEDVIRTIRNHNEVFNSVFNYPWTILNDEFFTEKFKERVIQELPEQVNVEFGKIDKDLWEFPDNVRDSIEYRESINQLGDKGIYYGQLESYHKMCRFFSGGFYKHPLVRKYEWYWRVEPGVKFYCNIVSDPFDEMNKRGKKYGFVVINEEWLETIPNLFRMTKAWLKKNSVSTKSSWRLFVENPKEKFEKLNEKRYQRYYKNIYDKGQLESRANEVMLIEELRREINNQVRTKEGKQLLTDSALSDSAIHELILRAKDKSRMPTLQGEMLDGETYNLKHFWTNFEIARVDLWDNPTYESYFQYLDESKGFYRERWGDAPVHSLALGFLLDIEEIHYFRDIGYSHTSITHCPANRAFQRDSNHRMRNADVNGVGCYCECPRNFEEIEDKKDFYDRWFTLTTDKKLPGEMISLNKIERESRTRLRKQKLSS